MGVEELTCALLPTRDNTRWIPRSSCYWHGNCWSSKDPSRSIGLLTASDPRLDEGEVENVAYREYHNDHLRASARHSDSIEMFRRSSRHRCSSPASFSSTMHVLISIVPSIRGRLKMLAEPRTSVGNENDQCSDSTDPDVL